MMPMPQPIVGQIGQGYLLTPPVKNQINHNEALTIRYVVKWVLNPALALAWYLFALSFFLFFRLLIFIKATLFKRVPQ